MKKSLGAKALVYPTPVFVVGTYDKEGKPDVMTASWAGICCSRPPCIAVSLRKATLTYGNIVERRAFTINVPSVAYVKQTDYFGVASGRDVEKFSVTGLTPTRSELVDAPYVEEFPMVLECKLAQSLDLGLHTLFVGYILDVKVDESALLAEDMIDMQKVNPLVFTPDTQSYYAVGEFVGKAFSVGKSVK